MTVVPTVELIRPEQTLLLRQQVLRPYQRIEECVYPEDNLSTTIHLGVHFGQSIVSIATFMMERHDDLPGGFPFRLRGMATDPKYRNQGMGSLLLQEGVLYLKSMHCDLLWFNARLKAFAFYEKLGFNYHGRIFHMDNIGPHKVMYKHLIPR